MIEVKICRGSTTIGRCDSDDSLLNWGDDISDPLLSTEDAAQERGRVEIDKSYSNRIQQSLGLHRTAFIQPGSIIQTVEGVNINNGILRSIFINFDKSNNSLSVGSSIGVEQNV